MYCLRKVTSKLYNFTNKKQSYMTVFYLDAKLSSFQYVSVNGAALLSMYKYILFNYFGEVFKLKRRERGRILYKTE